MALITVELLSRSGLPGTTPPQKRQATQTDVYGRIPNGELSTALRTVLEAAVGVARDGVITEVLVRVTPTAILRERHGNGQN